MVAIEGLKAVLAPSATGFSKRAALSHLYPLWEMETLHQTGEPRPEPVAHWRWEEVQSLIAEAVAETTTSSVERRVLLLGNPAYPQAAEQPHITPAMHGALQVLMPGENARPHRHTPNALRVMLEDGGETYSIVDGKPCLMERGDVVLTPANTWHGHYHHGSSRSVWFDALDSHLVQYFDAGFFEPANDSTNMPVTIADGCFVEAGLSPVLPDTMSDAYSPRFRYPWSSISRALDASPGRDDGSTWVRFVNPAGGGMAMPPLDCFMVRLSTGWTSPTRSTAGTICVAVKGSGELRTDKETIAWSENDIFTIPHWAWSSHRAASADATLFIVSDRGVLERLQLLREETL